MYSRKESTQDFGTLANFLKNNLILFKENVLLNHETYFKAGGSVRLYVLPDTTAKFAFLIKHLKEVHFEYKIVGFTSNVYFLDELNYGVVISTKLLTNLQINKKEQIIEVECGYSLADLVRLVLINDGVGFEGLEGIPASVGGALFMNAGAYGYSISDNLQSVKVLDLKGNILSLDKSKCSFKHRSSIFRDTLNYTILSANFAYNLGNQKRSAKKIRTFHIARHQYQEFAFPNLGTMFSMHNSEFYKEVMRKSFFYSFTCVLLKLLLKNPIAKFIRRKNPNNVMLNLLTMHYLKKDIDNKMAVSEKSLNILMNDGKSDFNRIYEHITTLDKKLRSDTFLENEIVLSGFLESSFSKKVIQKGDVIK